MPGDIWFRSLNQRLRDSLLRDKLNWVSENMLDLIMTKKQFKHNLMLGHVDQAAQTQSQNSPIVPYKFFFTAEKEQPLPTPANLR